MENESKNHPPALGDPFGTKELIQLVAKKLSSQALLFALAMVVILVAAGWLFKDAAPPILIAILVAILAVFIVGTAGYLFIELKRKVEGEDAATMNNLLGEKIETIGNRSGPFSVEVWTTPAVRGSAGSRDVKIVPSDKRNDYRIGDKIVVHFRAGRDCYLTLLNIGTSGKLTVLYPNALHQDNRIRADEPYQIPEPEDGFEYELQGPPGIERLKAIATLEKVSLLETQFTPNGVLFRTVSPTSGARDIGVIKKKIDSIPTDGWTEGKWEFRVGE